MDRRNFLKTTAAAAALTTLGRRTTVAASEKVVVGIMGLGGRGSYLANSFAARADCRIAYLCDADRRRIDRILPSIEKAQNAKPKLTQDFRRILDDKSVDVLINATPDHWHGLGAIMACQAGKDVYVEKPMCHNLYEGRKMIEAARKYKRVVQVGMQTRSAPYMAHVRDYIKSGKIGDVKIVRVFNMMQHSPMKLGSPQPVPEPFDYDMWTGPAKMLPYDPNRRWLNIRQYSCGPIPGDAVHQLDLARFVTGDIAYPNACSQTGSISVLKDGRDTPDTQLALFEYDDFTLLFEACLWSPYMKKIPQSVRNSDQFPDWPFSSTKIEVMGTTGFVYIGRHGGGWQAYDSDCKPIASEYGRQADAEHQDNFIDCVRTRKRANADVEQGHYTAALCHLANISYYAGNIKLALDPKTERFPDSPQANKLLGRTYRKPWVVPQEV